MWLDQKVEQGAVGNQGDEDRHLGHKFDRIEEADRVGGKDCDAGQCDSGERDPDDVGKEVESAGLGRGQDAVARVAHKKCVGYERGAHADDDAEDMRDEK